MGDEYIPSPIPLFICGVEQFILAKPLAVMLKIKAEFSSAKHSHPRWKYLP